MDRDNHHRDNVDWSNVNSIDDFIPGDILGKGAFGTVTRMFCKKNNMKVAVKVIDKSAARASKMLERVRLEREIHAQFNHPSIVKLYKSFEDEKNVYLVMELCENGELQSYMMNRYGGKPFSEFNARVILRQIVDGLIYLHDNHKVIHRDLKLANILLTEDRKIKIADFGLSCKTDQIHQTLCGTPNYMSPEVVTRSSQSKAIDVYSLGCVLYTLLVGHPPFDSHVTSAVFTHQTLSPPEIPPNLSDNARDLILAMLKKDSKERITLEEIKEHPFLKRSSVTKPEITRSCDSGLGSSGSPSLGSFSSTRSNNSDSERYCKRSSRFDSNFRDSQDENAHFSQETNVLPRFGKSPRLISSDSVSKHSSANTLRSKMVMVRPPSLRSADFYENEKVFANSVGQEIDLPQWSRKAPSQCAHDGEIHHNSVERGRAVSKESIQSERFREASNACRYEPDAHQNFVGQGRNLSDEHICQSRFRETSRARDCSPCSDRGACGSNHSGNLNFHHCPNNSQGSCHCNAAEHASCCSQCTDVFTCGREHCKQQVCASKSCPRKKNQLHNHLVSSNCCHHNIRNGDTCDQCNSHPSCSHYGHCDLQRCMHTDLCHCRTAKNMCQHGEFERAPQQRPISSMQVSDHVDVVSIKVPNLQRKVRDEAKKSHLPKCLNTKRLQPIRKMYQDVVVHILQSGDVCLEKITPYKDKHKVTYVYRISNDGMRIVMYKVANNDILQKEPSPVPAKGADMILGYERLNDAEASKHRKVYEYAALFVEAVRAKTAKISYHTSLGKCMIMENKNCEFNFNDGFRLIREMKNNNVLKIVHPKGRKSDIKLDDIDSLEDSIKTKVKHFLMAENFCRNSENFLEDLGKENIGDVFPVTFGRSGTIVKAKVNKDKTKSSSLSSNDPIPPRDDAIEKGSRSENICKRQSENESDAPNDPRNKVSTSMCSTRSEPGKKSSLPKYSQQNNKCNSKVAETEKMAGKTQIRNSQTPCSSSKDILVQQVAVSDIPKQHRSLDTGEKPKASAKPESHSINSPSSRSLQNSGKKVTSYKIDNVGRVTQYFLEEDIPCVEMHYIDGTKLKVVAGGHRGVYFTGRDGIEKKYFPGSYPKILEEKMKELCPILEKSLRDVQKRKALRELPVT